MKKIKYKKEVDLTKIFNKCQEIIKKNNGELITTSFKNINSRLRIKCSNGHLITKNKNSLYKNSWCKKCKVFKNENICKGIFESLFDCSFNKCRPEWLRNPKTNRKLELDGYNKELKLAFEYDGEFHYKKSKSKNYTSKKVLEQQYRDGIKDKLCSENDIILIRIPYTIKKENYQEYITKLCYKNNIYLINNNKVNIKEIKQYCTKLEEIKKYAKDINLELLSEVYLKAKNKLEWKCINNHTFQITYYNLQKRKNKCKLCKL